MADSLRNARGQRARGNSRASSNRSSAVYDGYEYLQPGAYYARHSLRPADSRFSLNEQFAATRREYEFGFDDASSILERSTIASNGDQDDTVRLNVDPLFGSGAGLEQLQDQVARDYYELLCLAKDPTLSQDQIRRAYYRLFKLLNSEKVPPQLQGSAEVYFTGVQAAFETLIEPSRRIAYDQSICDDGALDLDVERVPQNERQDGDAKQPRLQLRRQEYPETTDLGIRYLAIGREDVLQRRRRLEAMRPLDFSVNQSMTTGIPTVGRVTESAIQSVQRALRESGSMLAPERDVRCGVPTITLSGSAYGLIDGRTSIHYSTMSDRYQPLLPEILPRSRITQLVENGQSAAVTARYRQELFWRPPPSKELEPVLPDTVVEVETDILPEPSLTTRISNVISIEGEEEPLHVELMLNTSRSWTRGAPRAGVALHRRVNTGGNVFLCADSGDWSLFQAETCKYFDRFSRINKRATMRDGLLSWISPTVEVGYSTSPYELGLRGGQALTRPADRGINGLDAEMDDFNQSVWTVSGAVSGSGHQAGYLRYGRDLFAGPSPSQKRGGFRVEAELSAGSRLSDSYLALRSLKRIGTFAKLGLEVGISASSLHLSLYWSRLGHRINLPFLVSSHSHRQTHSTRLLFWTTVLPFATFALFELWRRKANNPPPKSRAQRLLELGKEKLAEYIARRRAEADELTALLAAAVEPRQAAEKARGGLVVLSAKYGVKDAAAPGGWAATEEVADVTVAVAALVDGNGEVVIPRGLRKSQILGFWDPAPLRTKVLLVRYLYRGKEAVVEVSGREELRLP